jgi:hypothetical protein
MCAVSQPRPNSNQILWPRSRGFTLINIKFSGRISAILPNLGNDIVSKFSTKMSLPTKQKWIDIRFICIIPFKTVNETWWIFLTGALKTQILSTNSRNFRGPDEFFAWIRKKYGSLHFQFVIFCVKCYEDRRCEKFSLFILTISNEWQMYAMIRLADPVPRQKSRDYRFSNVYMHSWSDQFVHAVSSLFS